MPVHGGSGNKVPAEVVIETASNKLNKPAPVTAKSQALTMLGITLIYATCFVAIKAGLAFAPPLFFGGIRALIAGAALLGIVALLGGPLFPPRKYWPWLIALATTATTITFGGMFLSPGRTGAGIASVLGNTQPFITLLLAALFLGEKITKSKAIVLVVGLIGVGLISAPAWLNSDIYSFLGSLAALASSAGAAAGNIIVKRMGTQINLLSMTAWQLFLGSLPLLIISAILENTAKVNWNLEFAAILLFLALVGTALTTALWYWLVQRGDVSRLALFFFLVPVFGLGLAAFIFGEKVSLFEVSGVILIIGAIGLVIWDEVHTSPSTLKSN